MAHVLPTLLGGLLVLMLVGLPSTQAAPRVATAASAGRTFAAAARSVDAGGRLTVTGLQLEGQATPATLELQRLEVWDPAAQVVVQPGGGAPPTTRGPPNERFFGGSLAGAPGSAAVLAVDAAGGVRGEALHGSQRWALGLPPPSPVAAASSSAPAGLLSKKAAPSVGAASGGRHRCAGTKRRADRRQQAQQAQLVSGQNSTTRRLLAASPLVASVALETDGELYRLVGGTTAAVVSYVSRLVALANTVFIKEIGVELRIVWLGVYPNPKTDPWPSVKVVDPLLDALTAHWSDPANKRTGIRRTLVHLLSGQPVSAGIAELESLCAWHESGGENSFDYGVSAGATGRLDWSGNSADYPAFPVWNLWLSCTSWGNVTPGDPTTIDDCTQSEDGCPQAKFGVLPSCTARPGYVGGVGTIMGYCVNVRNRDEDVSLTFGLNHPCGRRPERVVTAIKQYVQSRAAEYPACFRPTVPAPPPVPIQPPDGKWSSPMVVPRALPFTSAIIDKYWTTDIPGNGQRLDDVPADYATNRDVFVYRWFADWAHDNARVTLSSCGRLLNSAAPSISVRSSPNSNNLGPWTFVANEAYNCPPPSQKAFTTTFTAAGDTFYYLIVGADYGAGLKPNLTFSMQAKLGTPRGSWANPVAVPVDPNGGSTRASWASAEYKSFVATGLPTNLCTDGSSSRPYFAFRWFSGAGMRNGAAWRRGSKLTLSSCGHTATSRPALSVRKSKNLANPAAGPFTCVSRKADGCGIGVYGFKVDLAVEANTHYWFVLTASDAGKPPAKFKLTAQLAY